MTLLRQALFGWAPRGVLTAALMMLVTRRIGVVFGRLDRLMGRFLAGKATRRVPASEAVARVVVVGPDWVAPVNFWPMQSGWLLVAMGEVMRHHAAWYTQALERILREPDYVALLAASPQARRLLRPTCRMLGVDLSVLGPVARDAVVVETVPRVRARKPPEDVGRIPLPRGVIGWARREKRIERARLKLGLDAT